jgi:hypothetical protein
VSAGLAVDGHPRMPSRGALTWRGLTLVQQPVNPPHNMRTLDACRLTQTGSPRTLLATVCIPFMCLVRRARGCLLYEHRSLRWSVRQAMLADSVRRYVMRWSYIMLAGFNRFAHRLAAAINDNRLTAAITLLSLFCFILPK